MADNEWGDLEAQFVTKLRETKTEPVPEAIVKLAQRAYDGAPHPLGKTDSDGKPVLVHAMQYEAPTPEKAQAFAKHMRNAGAHTKPVSSVAVVVDPERTKVQDTTADGKPRFNSEGKAVMVDGPVVNPKLVAFRVGPRRGKSAGNGS